MINSTIKINNNLEEIVINKREIDVSFEFFPPKNEEMESKLWQAITKLKNLNPNFVSVTYGAGGSTRERTHATVKKIIDETNLNPASHLTCIAASKNEINDILHNSAIVSFVLPL